MLPEREDGLVGPSGESHGGPHPKKASRASEPSGRLRPQAEWQFLLLWRGLCRFGVIREASRGERR